MLTTDISLTMDESWTGIASQAGQVFSGTFDGGGKTITLDGLAVSGNTSDDGIMLAGLFARIDGTEDDTARVKNLTVAANVTVSDAFEHDLSAGIIAGYSGAVAFENITITGNVSVTNTATRLFLGGIAGTSDGSTITNCVNNAEIRGTGKSLSVGLVAQYDYVGGIVGLFTGGTVISNCRNTGDIYGVSTGVNIFTGGIAGGSTYGLSGPYYGRIEDSSSSGNIDARGGALWSFAGGIAGVAAGASEEGSTRIVRCHASGAISGSISRWCYVGGIVGYNYIGALVSQCYFEGSVSGTVYTGGIAGYNSQSAEKPSVIEDCWSTGTVSGTTSAAGIAGLNYESAVIRRCYTTAAISATTRGYGIGGITGDNMGPVENCAALNPSLTSTAAETGIHRVFSSTITRGSNNYAWKDMPITTGGTYTPDVGVEGADGADCDAKPAEAFYRETLGWNFDTVWEMGLEGYPVLQWAN